jgi:pimeloyl-ACP methyl ester carboxylesterase
MPFITRGDATLYYEEYGSGYPILLLSPGSLLSTIDAWHHSPWDPTVELRSEYRVIAMDQRNAGQSRAPITASDDWETFYADQVALLDHLDIQHCHTMGACIGVSFALKIMQHQPGRLTAAVMQQPIGANAPRTESGGFDRWVATLTNHPEATSEVLRQYHDNLYGPLFVYSVDRAFVRSCTTPMLVLPGNDQAHPYEIAEELAQIAPNAEFIPEWKEGEAKTQAFSRVREFLKQHTPAR